MRKLSVIFVFIGIVLFANYIFAGTQIHDWLGEYKMNHDGWTGTLRISGSKVDCFKPAWCGVVIRYRDAKGNLHKCRIKKMDQNLNHMEFYIHFPNNWQKFDAYLFSWDKSKMAGTTIWKGSTFGFYAFKK